jgi:hypothetical protein
MGDVAFVEGLTSSLMVGRIGILSNTKKRFFDKKILFNGRECKTIGEVHEHHQQMIGQLMPRVLYGKIFYDRF